MAITRVDVVDKSRRTEQAEAEAFCLSLPTEPENLAAASCFEKFFALSGRMYSRETKNGPRVMDIRPLLRNWAVSKEAADKNNSAGATVTFVADWRTNYLSPLLLCTAILEPLGADKDLRPRMQLLKTAQIFANAKIYP